MKVSIPKETRADERRVALAPDTVKKLVASGFSVVVEAEAGLEAGFPDAEFTASGAAVQRNRAALLAEADVLTWRGFGRTRPMSPSSARAPPSSASSGRWTSRKGSGPFSTRASRPSRWSWCRGHARAGDGRALVDGDDRRLHAVVIAALRLPKMLPILTTAAGTIPARDVVVIGAGVAGLMAIATARRLGATSKRTTSARRRAKRSARLGARFLDVDLGDIQTPRTPAATPSSSRARRSSPTQTRARCRAREGRRRSSSPPRRCPAASAPLHDPRRRRPPA